MTMVKNVCWLIAKSEAKVSDFFLLVQSSIEASVSAIYLLF